MVSDERAELRARVAETLRQPLPVPSPPQGDRLPERLERAAIGWIVDANRYLGARHRWRILRAAALYEAAGRAWEAQ